ncbi:hypothetical protein F6B43_07885 [Microbacterium rhizomatis]|uniref:DUF4430 domain-containing protein n=1 Tax=Microbacterium rhizomatis TaxID=1631477 RepID=A0A5J5J8E7_9MICO|nr:hypothetical protein [Microbacterium rhizomatis]KAA9111739.1 hypothetical protein F6B43_07885 [Microbacterium rhizomatis]
MSLPRVLVTAAATAALLVTLAACASTAATSSSTTAASSSASASASSDSAECTGVRVVVETGDLAVENGPAGSTCISTTAPIAATAVLADAGLKTEGTTQYGDQVVCRVNGVPAADFALTAADGSQYFETCAAMPAAFAYWSLWVKPAGGEWAYAEEGLSTLQLQPGESLELLFTLNGAPASPSS